MNKSRVENFSDGVFAVVITLLIFDIKLPALPAQISDAQLWQAIGSLVPLLAVYFMTFGVLSVIWINHHFLFHAFAKSVDRWLNLLNLAYLMFVAFVPFSALLIGSYPTHQPAAIIYGLNLLIIVALSSAMMVYMRRQRGELLNDEISPRLLNQARFRARLSLSCYVLGLLCTFVSVPVSLFLYAFPVLFNIIPGTLDLAEQVFRFDLS